MIRANHSTTTSLASSSRRRFLRGTALAAGAAALPAASLASTPKRGGVLRYACAHGSTTDSLDPGTYENDFTISMSHLTHNFIAEVDHNNDLIPELAESWEHSNGAKTWTFSLRRGVEFHNGKTVTAQDVIASINHHRKPDTSSAVAQQVKPIVDMKADGDHRLVITLDAGNVDFLFTLADYHIPVLPSVDGEVDVFSRVGCGPFVSDEFDPGVRYRGIRHANYWKEGRPYFDEVVMLSIIDAAARTNALTSGDVDFIGRVDLTTVHLLERNQSIRVHAVPGFQHFTFPMLTDREPFTDNNVRMAIKLAARRDEMVQKVLKGYGSIGNDHPIGERGVFFNADLPIREYDPERAQWFLRQSGHERISVDINVADAAFDGAVDAAVLYAESARPAGIDINVVREPNDGYWSTVWLTKPWCASYWGGRVVPDQMFTTTYAAGAAWNETHWDHPRFNQLLVAGRAESDPAKRAEIYGEMQLLVRDEGGAVVPMFSQYVFATTDKVLQGPLASNWDLDGHRFAERWWFV